MSHEDGRAAGPASGVRLDCSWQAPALSRHTGTLKKVLAVTAFFMVAEAVGGVLANSLALLSDAAHMLSDVAAVSLSLFVAWMAERPATPEKTYGYLRLEILAALVNGALLLVVAAFIVVEAFERFRDPVQVEPRIMFGVAVAGLAANLAAMRLLHGGHEHSLNLKGAYLHVIGDLLGSVGAIAAGVVIFLTGWNVADPIVSVVVALLIVASALKLVRESADILLESTPRHIELSEVLRSIETVPGVTGVHDLHVWTVTSGMVAMSGHAVVADPENNQEVLERVQSRMAELGIDHVTVQIERNHTCEKTAV